MRYYQRVLRKTAVAVWCALLFTGSVIDGMAQVPAPKPGSGKVDGIYAGVAKVDITPPVGGRLAGHFYETLSTGVRDPLFAKALLLQQGDEKVVMVFCDLIGMTAKVSGAARSEASRRTGIPVENILIAATHSHTGPLFYGFQYHYFHDEAVRLHGADPHEKVDYSKFLVGKLVAAVEAASRTLSPVVVEAGVGRLEGISFNRRYHMKDGSVLFNPGPLNPDITGPAGPVDPDVGILLLREKDSRKYKAGLTVFAMHADGVGGSALGADYPGHLAKTLKRKFGGDFLSAFGLGPCGDINHVNVKKDDPIYSKAQPRRFGRLIGKAVIREVPNLETVRTPALEVLSSQISLPLQVPRQAQIDSAKELIRALYEVKASGAYIARAGGESGDFLKRVEMSKYISLEGRGEVVRAEVQVIKVGAETAIVALPGEIFADLGLAIKKRSPFANTLVVTVCNDRISYIPTRKAFAEGSYEVTNSIVKPGAGEMLVDKAVAMLEEVAR